MRRRVPVIAIVTAVMVMALGGAASAKGPESATITGPGIDQPIDVMEGDPELLQALMGQTGLWYAASYESRLPGEPEGELGPAYTLIWINTGPPADPVEKRTIRQILYPFASGGPVIHTPEQEGLAGWGPGVTGWIIPPGGLMDTLVALGVPVSTPKPAGPAARAGSGALVLLGGFGYLVLAGAAAGAAAGWWAWRRRRTLPDR